MTKLRNIRINSLEFWLIVTIAALIIIRCAILPFTPQPFAMDEAASGAHIASMVLHSTNAHGEVWPLFSSSLGGGYTTPIYLYPAALWAFVFGVNEVSLRYFSEIMTILAVLLLAYGMRIWTDRRTALITASVGLAVPWGWLQGSIAWDPALVPFVTSITFVAFSLLLHSKSRRVKYTMLAVFPVSLMVLAYLYPPLRVGASLLFIAGYALLYAKKVISVLGIILTAIGSLVLALPLLQFMRDPDSFSRSQNLLVFQHAPFAQAIGDITINIVLLFNPWFFFINGDPNLRHSTGFQGMLGWAAIPATVALVMLAIRFTKTRKIDNKLLIGIALFGIFAGILGSALTDEGQPHSLRATAAWPFLIILLALGWRYIFTLKDTRIIYASVGVFLIGTTLYAVDFTQRYHKLSDAAFDHSLYENVLNHREPTYPGIAADYYELRR